MKREYVVSSAEMKRYDTNTMEKIGLSSSVLMERAALCVAEEVLSFLRDNKKASVLIICGNGNNGADGVCTGRILAEYEIKADICLIKSARPYTKELQKQLNIISHYPISFVEMDAICYEKYDLIVDAIFGIGLNRDVVGTTKELIEQINDSKLPVISVDIPSGIDATTGKVLGCAVEAMRTVTFGFYKCGQILYPGRKYCGKLIKAKMGINETGFWGHPPNCFTYLPQEQTKTLDSMRSVDGNKSTFGKVFVIAGRKSTPGAALLCAKSALRSGCGMVAVFTQEENKGTLLAELPEAMIETYSISTPQRTMREKLQKWIAWADTIVVGPGIGCDELAYTIMKHILCLSNIPIVFDADALRLFAKKQELIEQLYDFTKRNLEPLNTVVFTPHPGEMAALAGCSVSDMKANRMAMISKVLERYPVILVAKDADTIVCGKNQLYYLNLTGNDGLSTAGSGDVLAGLCASLLAQGRKSGIPVFDAVCECVYFHGKAADVIAKKNGKSFMVASDLIEAYKYMGNTDLIL